MVFSSTWWRNRGHLRIFKILYLYNNFTYTIYSYFKLSHCTSIIITISSLTSSHSDGLLITRIYSSPGTPTLRLARFTPYSSSRLFCSHLRDQDMPGDARRGNNLSVGRWLPNMCDGLASLLDEVIWEPDQRPDTWRKKSVRPFRAS